MTKKSAHTHADRPIVVRVFRSAIRLVRRERSLGDAGRGLRIPKLSALEALAAAGDKLGLEELAERERVREPTLLATLSMLKAAGLVRMTRASRGRRRVYVRITEQGGAQLEWDRRRLNALFAGLSERELEIVDEAVQILDAVLDRDLAAERDRRRTLGAYEDEIEEEDQDGISP